MAASIGMATRWSQVCDTRCPRPLPSLPTTMTSGPVVTAGSRSGSSIPPPIARPMTVAPDFWAATSQRTRLVARATGTRDAAPAEVFQAEGVIPAARRSGITTPCAPKAAAERTTAPRLRGSVTPSRTTNNGWSPDPKASASRSSGSAYLYGGTRSTMP